MKALRLASSFVALLLAFLDNNGAVRADNPIVQTIYTADPAPIVYNNRLYCFTDHDLPNSSFFNMTDWRLFSTADMVNWQDHGVVMSLKTFSWASANAWAGQVINRNNKFYYYAPMTHGATGAYAIGVGVSDNITGPYVDALGHPLVENNEIDPTVFIDDDGQAYLYWANPDLWYVKLNQDMISYSGSPAQIPLTVAGFGARQGSENRTTSFEEGPWVYKRNGIYYNVFAADCCSEDIRYSTSPGPLGPWTFTNHPAVIDFMGNSYFFYHNGALPGGGGFERSVAVEKFVYNADGSIPQMNMTTTGAPRIATLNPYQRQEAELIAWSSGVSTEVCSEGGLDVCNINNGDYIKVEGVDFGTNGAKSFLARVASATSGGSIQLHLGSVSGKQIGSCTVPSTGGWQTWTTVTCSVSGVIGVQDLFFVYSGSGTGFLFNVNWWQFS
ncbi:carbohydrate-binding module family 6 protein [Trichoderma chlorosporum]